MLSLKSGVKTEVERALNRLNIYSFEATPAAPQQPQRPGGAAGGGGDALNLHSRGQGQQLSSSSADAAASSGCSRAGMFPGMFHGRLPGSVCELALLQPFLVDTLWELVQDGVLPATDHEPRRKDLYADLDPDPAIACQRASEPPPPPPGPRPLQWWDLDPELFAPHPRARDATAWAAAASNVLRNLSSASAGFSAERAGLARPACLAAAATCLDAALETKSPLHLSIAANVLDYLQVGWGWDHLLVGLRLYLSAPVAFGSLCV